MTDCDAFFKKLWSASLFIGQVSENCVTSVTSEVGGSGWSPKGRNRWNGWNTNFQTLGSVAI